jgi:effector-binding domain-containing protein
MKKVLYVILALVVIYLVLCLIGPADTRVERTGMIQAPASAVQATLADFNTFQKWSPWKEYDPNMKITVEGEPGKPGHKYAWEGNKDVGKGTMTLDGINGDTVNQTLDMGYGPSKVYMVTKEENGATNLTWGFYAKTPFFFRAMGLFMNMDKMLGKDFEKGIANLKTLVESSASAAPAKNYEVKETTWEERTFYGKRGKMGFQELSAFFGATYPKLFEDAGKNKVEPQGPPSALYFSWDDSTGVTECAAVIPVKNDAKLKGWEKFTTPAANVLHIEYYGAYDKSIDAHLAMDKYMKEKGLAQAMVMEEYVTDPQAEKDTAKWLTNIYYILRK